MEGATAETISTGGDEDKDGDLSQQESVSHETRMTIPAIDHFQTKRKIPQVNEESRHDSPRVYNSDDDDDDEAPFRLFTDAENRGLEEFKNQICTNNCSAVEHYTIQKTLFDNLNIEDQRFVDHLQEIKLPYLPNIFDELSKAASMYHQLRSAARESQQEGSSLSLSEQETYEADNDPQRNISQQALSDEELSQYLSDEHAALLQSSDTAESLKEILRGMAVEKQGRLVAEQRTIAAEQRTIAAEQRTIAAEQRMAVEKQGRLVEKQGRLVEKQKAIAANLLYGTVMAVKTTQEVLASASTLSQAEVIKTTVQHQSFVAKKRKIDQQSATLTPAEDCAGLPLQNATNAISKLFKEVEKLDATSLFHRERLTALDDDAKKGIQQVSDAFNEVFKRCSKFLESHSASRPSGKKPDSEKEYKSLVESGIKALDAQIRIRRDQCEAGEQTNDFHLPGPRSQEKLGSQPVFYWLLEQLGSVAEDLEVKAAAKERHEKKSRPKEQIAAGASDKSDPKLLVVDSPAADGLTATGIDTRSSPCKTQPQREKAVVGLNDGTDPKLRIGDFVVTKRGNFLPVYPPDALPLLIELKPLLRSNSSFQSLEMSAKQQIVNHLAAHLRMCFNFSGVGSCGYATGVVATLAFVQVFRLELVDMGTEKTRVRLSQSEKFPLMTEENFVSWTESNLRGTEKEEDISNLHKELYPDNGAPENLGLMLLYHCMTASTLELVSRVWENESKHCETLLGLGNFSFVFRHVRARGDRGPTQVIKVSRMGRVSQFNKECAILRFLDDHRNKNLPHLVKCGMLPINFRAVRFDVPAMILKPEGIPLLRTGLHDGFIDLCIKDIKSALKFIHQRNIIHCDVSLNNLVYDGQSGSVILIDFSNARGKGTKVDWFDGTLDTAHRDIHCLPAWAPLEFHDTTALGFTMVLLCNHGQAPWEPIHHPFGANGTELAKKRLEGAVVFLKSRLRGELQKDLMQLVQDDEAQSCGPGCNCQKMHCKGCSCTKKEHPCTDLCACVRSCCKNSRTGKEDFVVPPFEITSMTWED